MMNQKGKPMGTDIVATGKNLRPTTPHTPLTLMLRVSRLEDCRIRTGLYPREPSLTETERAEAEGLVPAYRAYLTPGKRDEISARILTLRAHYFMPDMPKGLADAVADDWTDDMSAYPLWAVKAACDRYRRSQATRAPRPADIIAFAEEEIEHERQQLHEIEMALSAKPAEPEPDVVSPEQVAAILENHGHQKMMDEATAERERKRQPSPSQLAMRERAHEAAMETFRRGRGGQVPGEARAETEAG